MKRYSWARGLAMASLFASGLVSSTGFHQVHAASSRFSIVLRGHVPTVVASGQAHFLRPHSASAMLHIAVGLRIRHRKELDRLLNRPRGSVSPAMHGFLTQHEENERFMPTVDQEQRVISWLESGGFRVTKTYANHLLVDAEGPTVRAERLLHISINDYQDHTGGIARTFFAPATNPVVDGSVAASVAAIAGLDDSTQFHMASNGNASGNPPYYPQDFANAYGVNPVWDQGATGSGQQIAITLWNMPPPDATLEKFASHTGASVATQTNHRLHVISIDGGTTESSDQGDGEAGMDIEYASAMAPAATINFYEIPFDYSSKQPTWQGIADALNQAAQDGNEDISSSWSTGCEDSPTSGTYADTQTVETILEANEESGHTYFFSSGDSGSSCTLNGSTIDPYPQFPASSPYVTAVGGTRFSGNVGTTNCNTSPDQCWPGETSWSGSGHGQSNLFDRPAWQEGASVASTSGKRAYPDVAADADAATGAYICYATQQTCDGNGDGTSLATPLWAGMAADLRHYLAGLGTTSDLHLDPLLYTLGSQTQPYPPFHHTDWDAVTGWGSPDLYNLARDAAVQEGVAYTVPITAGWNLITVPMNNGSLGSLSHVVQSLKNSLGSLAITAAGTYSGGRFSIYIPGFSVDQPLAPGQAIVVLSIIPGKWFVAGRRYTSGQPVALHPGWNFVAAPYPYEGLWASAIARQASACGVQEIATFVNGAYNTWVPGGTNFYIANTAGWWILCSSTSGWIPLSPVLRVTTTSDTASCPSGPGDPGYSLRCAINDVNADGAGDTIAFNIPSSDPGCSPTTVNGVTIMLCTISPTADLPLLTASNTAIDGYSQPGSSVNTLPFTAGDNAALTIRLDGVGLDIRGSRDTIEGLMLTSGGSVAAVTISATDQPTGDTVIGCFLGTDGIHSLPDSDGVFADHTSGTIIGGPFPSARNIISTNGIGIILQHSSNSVVQDNYIGVDASGASALTGRSGIYVYAGANNTIGGSSPNTQNVFAESSYASANGIEVYGSSGNTIQGNLIGTDVAGKLSLSGYGFEYAIALLSGSTGNLIGGASPNAGNTINSGGGSGVYISNSNDTTLQGNFVGTDATRMALFYNESGIYLENSANDVIGGSAAGNVIYGSGSDGILEAGGINNAFIGNSIGASDRGSWPRYGNRGAGLHISGSTGDSVIGNTIGDNQYDGIGIGTGGGSDNSHVLISRNAIFDNGDYCQIYMGCTTGLGIDLSNYTVNCNGPEPGTPNDSTPCPVIQSASTSSSSGTACSGCTVELFIATDEPDDSGYGEGVAYIASVVADSSGHWSKSGLSLVSGQLLTATATTPTFPGPPETSEFAKNVSTTSTITGLSPNSIQATGTTSGSDLPLGVFGVGFDSGAVVRWNGTALPTTFVSSTELDAAVPAAYIDNPATVEISVQNGNGTHSNPQILYVTQQLAEVPATDSEPSIGGVAVARADDTISASAAGQGTLALATYNSDPAAPATFANPRDYFDVHLSFGNAFTSASLRTCDLNGTDTVYWYNGTSWAPVSSQSFDATTGCATMTITSTTSPNLTNLAGTVFATGQTAH